MSINDTASIVRSLSQLRDLSVSWNRSGRTIGVVPTMGALHDGHNSLVRMAQRDCDKVIVTIFVNPKQFNNPDDLKNYPRTEKDDALKLAPYDVDVIYVPDPDQIYPDGFATTVSVSGLTDVLCGAHRPGHFDGVATVVAKLFLQTGAHRAYFGEKDFQQLQIVRRMATDLNIPIDVIGCPTIREPSGLAMSSRNLRLTPDGIRRAAVLNQVMTQAAHNLTQGAHFAPLEASARKALTEAGFSEVEYFELRDIEMLQSLAAATRPARLFAAAWIDGVRLIDNIAVSPA